MSFHSSAIIAGIAFVGSGTRVGYCFLAGEKSQFKSCNCSRGLQLKEKQRKHPWNEAEIRHKSRQLRKLSLVFWLFFLKTLKKRLNRESMPDLWKDLTRLSVQLNLSKQLRSWGIVNSLYESGPKQTYRISVKEMYVSSRWPTTSALIDLQFLLTRL